VSSVQSVKHQPFRHLLVCAALDVLIELRQARIIDAIKALTMLVTAPRPVNYGGDWRAPVIRDPVKAGISASLMALAVVNRPQECRRFTGER
jgi:hypothetical protein